jgi:hypothetical protein
MVATEAAVTIATEAATTTMTATSFSLRFHTDQDDGQSGQRDARAEHISIHRNSSKNKSIERLPDNCVVFHGSTEVTLRRCTALRGDRA